MTANGYRGEVDIRIGGQLRILRFGWGELSALQAELGEDAFDAKIGAAISALDLPVLAQVLAIGLRESWPGVTPQMITEASPPLAEVTAAITVALKRSFHGMGEVPVSPDQNPPQGRLKRALVRLTSFWKG